MSDDSIRMPIEILLITVEEAPVLPLEEQLTEVAPFQFIIDCARSVDEVASRLEKDEYDLILLDLVTDEGKGLEAFESLKAVAGDTPIVVLANVDDENLAMQAVTNGAQDYIVKGHVNTKYLANALRYAVTRQRLHERLVNEALLDTLTGLYNRRGLVSLGQQQLTMADRTKRGQLLFYVDLDDMHQINDSHGHKTGDQALIDTANIFRRSFRKSDIIARIGGDEYAVLAIETAHHSKDAVLKRLQNNIVDFNINERRPYHLSLSVGVASYDGSSPSTIESLLDTGESLMHQEKMRRKLGG